MGVFKEGGSLDTEGVAEGRVRPKGGNRRAESFPRRVPFNCKEEIREYLEMRREQKKKEKDVEFTEAGSLFATSWERGPEDRESRESAREGVFREGKIISERGKKRHRTGGAGKNGWGLANVRRQVILKGRHDAKKED